MLLSAEDRRQGVGRAINANAKNEVTLSLQAVLAAWQSDAVVARSLATKQSQGSPNEIATALGASQ